MSASGTTYLVPVVMERGSNRPLGVPLINTAEGPVLLVFASLEGQLSPFLNWAEQSVGPTETVNAVAVPASTLDEAAEIVRGQGLLPGGARLVLEGTEAAGRVLDSL